MIHLINNYYYVEVPEGTELHTIIYGNVLWFFHKNIEGQSRIELPQGNYTILCTTKELLESEELAKKVVEKHDECSAFKDYQNSKWMAIKATDSFKSLLRSKGITSFGLILQKK